MLHNQEDPIIVSKPLGNVDDCNPVQWLDRNYPDILSYPDKIENLTAGIEKKGNHYYITTYTLSKTKEKYLKVRIKWTLQIEGNEIEIWSTIYSSIKCPKNPENLREVALAKSMLLMIAETYIQFIVETLGPDQQHIQDIISQFRGMTQFKIETTPTGRIRNFTITTKEKGNGFISNTHTLKKALSPYFAVSTISDYESGAIIYDNGPDKLFEVIEEEKEGKINRLLIDYYTNRCLRLSQAFEEAYCRFIDVVAEDQVQKSIQQLRDMEAGSHERDLSTDEVREKFETVQSYISHSYEESRHEYNIMKESFDQLELIIDKFDSWVEHPELSLAQTSLIEAKVRQLSKNLNNQRLLLTALKSRFDKIEYWADWFKKHFPTLFGKLED